MAMTGWSIVVVVVHWWWLLWFWLPQLGFVKGSFVNYHHGFDRPVSRRFLALRHQSANGDEQHQQNRGRVVDDDAVTVTTTIGSPVVYDFCLKVQEAVTSDPPQMMSLILRGSSRSSQQQQQQEEQRGCIRQVQGRLIMTTTTSKKKKQQQQQEETRMLQLTFKYHGATDICKNIPISHTNHYKKKTTASSTDAIAATIYAIFYPSLFSFPSASSSSSSSLQPLLLLSQEEISSEWGLWTHDVATTNPLALQSAQLTLHNGTCWNLRLSGDGGSKIASQAPRLEKSKVSESAAKTKLSSSKQPQNKLQPFEHDDDDDDDGVLVVQPHDRVKSVWLASSSLSSFSFLQALGVTNEQGQPKNGIMASKLRQCHKFVEITSGLIAKALEQRRRSLYQQHQQQQQYDTDSMEISTMDMGCGRGYLTFALHSYLMQHYVTQRGNKNSMSSDVIRVSTKGVDVRPKLVQEISQIAKSLGPDFEGLTFETGSIDDGINDDDERSSRPLEANGDTTTAMTGQPSDQHLAVDMNGNNFPHDNNHSNNNDNHNSSLSVLKVLIALHACDTATDDALWWGISRQVDVIVVAPCCHKQLRPQLNEFVRQLSSSSSSSKEGSHQPPILDILRHAIYRERMAETITDSMRAMLLESANYNVQVFEFIGGEDTSKNVMITAVKRSQPYPKKDIQQLRDRLQAMAATYGISQQHLAMKMGISLVESGEDPTLTTTVNNNHAMRTRRQLIQPKKKNHVPTEP